MVISLLCVVCSALMAFMGTILNIVKQEYSVGDLGFWGIVFYVMAAILAFVAVIEFIRSIARLRHRSQRREEEERFQQVIQLHNKRAVNGTYIGGNSKNKGKTTDKTGKKYIS